MQGSPYGENCVRDGCHGEWIPSGSPLSKNLKFWPWDFPRDSIHHDTPSAFPHIVPFIVEFQSTVEESITRATRNWLTKPSFREQWVLATIQLVVGNHNSNQLFQPG